MDGKEAKKLSAILPQHCKVSLRRSSAPLKARDALRKEEKYNDEYEEHTRLHQLFLRMPESCLPLRGGELQMRLPHADGA